jgi:hypothetical protein
MTGEGRAIERERPRADATAAPPPGGNPFLFIVGCPRSGTTLLRRMVDAHPLIAIPRRETHWIPRAFRARVGMTPNGLVTHSLSSWLATDERFPSMGITVGELDAIISDHGPLTYATFVSRVFDLYATKEGKRLAGDKTPGYARELSLLHDLWPDARFVHLIRDGRDVLLSLRDWPKSTRVVGRFLPWSEDAVMSAALFWEWHVKLARHTGFRLEPGLYNEVRYEALVSQPAEKCAALCEFLGVPFSERMLLAGEQRRKVRPGADSKHSRLPPTAGLREWSSQLSTAESELFEAISGELLDELGYSRAVPQPSNQSFERARRFRELHAPDLPHALTE